MSGIDRIVYDNFVNYFYPQYVLPWNNFFGRIQEQPFYTRTVQINQNAAIAKTATQYDALPNIQTQEGDIPDILLALRSPSIGKVLLQDTKKFFTGKYYSLLNGFLTQTGLQYSYEFQGTIIDTDCQCIDGDSWIVLVFNLYPPQNNRKQSIALVGADSTPSLQGVIRYGANTVTITNPKTAADFDPATGNTVYSIAGNRLVLAVKLATPFTLSVSTVIYDLDASVIELFTTAEGLNYGSGNFNA